MGAPIFIIVGQAGSGKDAVADTFVKTYGAEKLALADPMKRFAKKVFGFTDEQLWGPSENRNATVPESTQDNWKYFAEAYHNFIRNKDAFAKELGISDYAPRTLDEWFYLVRRLGDETVVDSADETLKVFKGTSPRVILQSLGTEFGRHWNKNLWIDFALKEARTLLSGGYGYYANRGVFQLEPEENILPPNMVVISDGRFRNEVLAVLAAGGKAIKVMSVDSLGSEQQVGVMGHASEQEQKSIPDHWFDYVIVNDKSLGLEALRQTIIEVMEKEQPGTHRTRNPNTMNPDLLRSINQAMRRA